MTILTFIMGLLSKMACEILAISFRISAIVNMVDDDVVIV